jgi:predicted esterase
MHEHHITIERTARYYTLGSPGNGVEIWFVIHGYGQLARRFLREFRPLSAPHRLIVAPEALSRFYLKESRGHVGASWMTKEERLAEIDDYCRYLDRVYAELSSLHGARDRGSDGARLIVLGFSQGAATAARWAAMGSAAVDELVLWGGMLPPDLDQQAHARLRRLHLSIVVGTGDRYISPEQAEEARNRLALADIPYRWIGFEGGHEIDPGVLDRLAERPDGHRLTP